MRSARARLGYDERVEGGTRGSNSQCEHDSQPSHEQHQDQPLEEPSGSGQASEEIADALAAARRRAEQRTRRS